MIGLSTITVKIERASFTDKDRHGNKRLTHSDPEPLPAYAIAPATSSEPGEHGRRYAVANQWELYAPTGTSISPHDIITLPTGQRTQVIGTVENWQQNMWPTFHGTGGVRVTLELKEG